MWNPKEMLKNIRNILWPIFSQKNINKIRCHRKNEKRVRVIFIEIADLFLWQEKRLEKIIYSYLLTVPYIYHFIKCAQTKDVSMCSSKHFTPSLMRFNGRFECANSWSDLDIFWLNVTATKHQTFKWFIGQYNRLLNN